MKKITAINNAIDGAIRIIATNAKGPLQEPDYNAAFASELPTLLNGCGMFPNTRFGGCFIHKSPLATFSMNGNSVKCEVGDLLVVCHKCVDSNERFNAALIQWKKIKSGVTKLTGTALNQSFLYKNWPSFNLSSKGGRYDIVSKTVSPGAQYGLIQEKSSNTLFSCVIPSDSLDISDSVPFARFLINFMKWQTGRPFIPNSSQRNDEWSSLITHLIDVSLNKPYTASNVGKVNVPRGCLYMLNFLTSLNKGLTLFDDEHIEDAISILYINIDGDARVKPSND